MREIRHPWPIVDIMNPWPGTGQIVLLGTDRFAAHITIPTVVNAMLLGFFLADSRARLYWGTKVAHWRHRINHLRPNTRRSKVSPSLPALREVP